MSIKIREWYHHYESHDHQLDQLFGLMLGSTLTTLPFFIIMPIGAIIIYNVAVVDKNDRPFGYWPFFFTGLFSGLAIWATLISGGVI